MSLRQAVYRLILAATCVVAATGSLAAASPMAAESSCPGRWYRVQQGDSWSNLAGRTGISVAELKVVNAAVAQHPQGWLIVGQTLCLPPGAKDPAASTTPTAAAAQGAWITVRRGDSWAVLAARYGLSVSALQAANPEALRADLVLRPNDRIFVPATDALTAKVPCPDDLEALPAAAVEVLTEYNGNPEFLASYLARCEALTRDWGTVRAVDLRQPGQADVVMIAADPETSQSGHPLGLLAILGLSDVGWEVLYRSGVASDLALLAAEDLNDDGQPEVAWSDTTCSANACFTSVHVATHADGIFQDWIDDGTTMASAAVSFADMSTEGSGQELIMSGGLIGTVLAGPQRPVTTTWLSLNGAPYTLARQDFAPSFCLYHRVLDGNAALARAAQDQYAAALEAYRQAADDPRLVACWTRPNEVDELRAFALYRLALAHGYRGDLETAGQVVDELGRRFPNDPLAELARLWWVAYRTTRDASAACAVARTFAERHPDTWQRLADYGFANPDFSAEQICIAAP